MKTIAVYNLKGGVGKTATAVNIAYLSAGSGQPTLLWDFDAQAAASWYFQVENSKRKKASKLIKDKLALGELIQGTGYDRLDIIPSDMSNRNIDVNLTGVSGGKLDSWLSMLSETYGVLILDCPPTLSELALRILKAADAVLVTMIPTHLSFETYRHVSEMMEQKKIDLAKLHPVLTMIDRRKSIHQEFTASCKKTLGKTPIGFIPYCSDVEKMGEFREPLPVFAPKSPATLAYQLLWDNIRKKALRRR
ncbi:ParA family protein [Hahella sp. HN01]|uniref:ParA family protein n=1 Tax=Hahella sp. HN01 TaxID=2847262 RepID=UPI001C1EFA4C|nr:AAA family ATPase [Hahella sp. HN01]MBU6952160.1 AAA family ATPase [Hahella sp. HN01]